MNKFGLYLPGMRGRSIFQQDRDENQLKNQIYLIGFGHTEALLFEEKNMTRNGHFSRPAETDPYMWKLKGVMARIDPNGWALVCEGVSSS